MSKILRERHQRTLLREAAIASEGGKTGFGSLSGICASKPIASTEQKSLVKVIGDHTIPSRLNTGPLAASTTDLPQRLSQGCPIRLNDQECKVLSQLYQRP
jgi:hypothetical protein